MSLTAHIRTILFNCIWLTVLFVSLPWLLWRTYTKGKNRRGWKQKLFGFITRSVKTSDEKRIWLHAVSVGEVHVLKTLIDRLQRDHGSVQLFISTTTETGFDRASALFAEGHKVFFFPFDFSWAIRNVIDRIEPDLLILAELELWPNLIHLAADEGLPVMVANGRLSENSHANYQRFGWLTRPMFRKLSCVGVQDETYANRFIDLGCEPECVTVTGNLKYDSVQTNRSNVAAVRCRRIATSFGIEEGSQILVAGSTQIEDEVAAIDAWIALREEIPQLKLVIVPRHPDRASETRSLLEERGANASFRSAWSSDSDATEMTGSKGPDVLIVDVIGELAGWWALADVAFVGGSMGSRGGQNMIEPAAYGVPVCFGPNTSNFKSTVEGLLANDAAKVVADGNELAAFAHEMLQPDSASDAMGKRAQQFVLSHKGAVSHTVELICNVLERDSSVQMDRAA